MDNEEDMGRLLNMIRIGMVTAVDQEKRMVRVKYNDAGMPSGWLKVLATPPAIPEAGKGRTEYAGGGSGEAAYESHCHDLVIRPWMPKVNDTVLVLYLPVWNADGFVLGGL